MTRIKSTVTNECREIPLKNFTRKWEIRENKVKKYTGIKIRKRESLYKEASKFKERIIPLQQTETMLSLPLLLFVYNFIIISMGAIGRDSNKIQHHQRGLKPHYPASSSLNPKLPPSELDFLLRHVSGKSTKLRNHKPGKQRSVEIVVNNFFSE